MLIFIINLTALGMSKGMLTYNFFSPLPQSTPRVPPEKALHFYPNITLAV